MEQDTEYVKLPLEERLAHKSWRARLHGYEECVKTFQCIDDEKSPEWNKYAGLIKKFVVDSNAAAQEKGLEATLAFAENAAIAGKIVIEVMNGIVSKCIAAPKAKTKELAVQITLMYIEIEKHEAVQEELLKGTEAKNPKIVSACIATLTQALKEFGPKVVNIKPLMKKIANFLDDRDKTVREEGKAMVVEMYRWVGERLRQQLNTLKAVHIAELEAEFSSLGEEKVVPMRHLRSQKPKNRGGNGNSAAASDNGEDDNEDADGALVPDIDPYDLLAPVDILSKLPKDFYEKIEAKKWQERKEALEALEALVKNPKLENGDYGDAVRALKKIISKDTNVVVVTLAGKCLAGLATGLKKRFQPYAVACLPTILEKFREKKQTVVQALRDAADAIYTSISIDLILEDTLAALENKNPAVKAETAAYLARCFAHTPPANLNKRLLKSYTGTLLKTLNEPDPTVRDNSAEALGTAMKLIGEKAMMPFLTDIDNLKMTKIKECADKAVIVKVSSGTKKQERPNTAPAKVESQRPNKASKESSKSGKSSAAKRPNTGIATGKKLTSKKPGGGSSLTNLASSARKAVQIERNYTPEEIDEMAAELLPAEIITGLVDSNWKTRLAAVTQLSDTVRAMDSEVPTQVIVRTLAKKPGFKDTNFQVLKLRVEIVKYLAENHPFTATVAEYCLMDIAEKLADAKNSSIAAETLLVIAQAISFEYIADEVVAFAFNQKNPKVQQETLVWLCRGLAEFGYSLNVKSIIENIKKAVAATNPAVRTAAVTLLGTLYLYMGKPLLAYFDNEKPALRQQIEQECEKRYGETPPAPVRGAKARKTNAVNAEDEEEDVEESEKKAGDSEPELNELIPRVDIGAQITEALLAELADKNWKVRNEALQKINAMVAEAKCIKSTIGDLPQGLALRLVDSNSKIAQAALGICETLATAIGPPVKQHVRVLFPGFLLCLGDGKNWIRVAAISCINTWGDTCGYKEFFDGEMIGDALKAGSPVLRSELWNWLAQKLPPIPVKQIPKEELFVCLPYLYANLEDRNSDVRKNAQEAVLGFMIHLSYEAMVRNTEKLKPGSRTVVIAALDKARPSLPLKPLPKKELSDDNIQKGAKGAKVVKAVKSGTSSKPGSARKKDDDVDTSPLLVVNNLKHQRVIDEQKLKVLKWNFTTPREEFVELLKDLMAAANVNKTLRANMFHSDFRYHLKAIEALTEDLPGNSKALVSNLDLILKWLTLRFFDTNPSVLLKGLDYLQLVFNMLIEDQYHVLENEAASFIPYLIIKIGDPKDAVRNGVRALFKQIALVYPVSKLFSYVMEGLKSKNARQRTECLDQLGSLIENYGISVCQPTPSAALKEVAKQIADRDNSVRNAALNCIVQAYFLEGERVFKFIGQISEKDRSLLDERIKRAAKNRPTKSASTIRLSTPVVATSSPPTDDMEADYEEEQEEIAEPVETVPELTHASTTDNTEEEQVISVVINKSESPSNSDQEIVDDDKTDTQNHPSDRDDSETNSPTAMQPKVPSGPFRLDMEFLQKPEVKCCNPVLPEPSLLDLNEPPVNVLNPPKTQMIPISPPKLLVSKSSSVVSPTSASSKDDTLERNILSMASMDLSTAIQSMNAIENLLQSHQAVSLQSKEDKFIGSINMQLKLLQTYPLRQENADVSRGFRNTFLVILVFYDTGFLGKNVPFMHLKELVDQMISLLAENKLEHLHQAGAYYRVINNIMVKIIDNSNHTTIICVLIKLLHSCAESNVPSKYEELVMKCLWKIVKTMSNWAADLDYDTILLEVHRFLKDYPTTWWKKRKSDTPLRTVKTVLHSMTRVKGSSILNHLTLINNTNESELHAYLIRLIASLKPDEINATAKATSKPNNVGKAPKHLSKSTRQQLAEIFKKIGSKEHTEEGLVQLYDFKLQYPEADVQPFLVKSHQFFQDFIEQGLREIDQARKSQTILSQTNNQYSLETTETSAVAADGKDMMDPMYRLQKLRALEAQNKMTFPPNLP
ncbi:PREDICTED: cytoskeleton-associated protein 5 isoform X2 [Vollenhovia emeryi]|uniref:cytoskeleton-associated protein 5 isoform X2 n=1 Tax=Vollenhovia emeryi TaxID=411798 RepID=UPI0005F48D1C|nr:PREDICTED: cytoskeleton-associated protein 5 isoform X2 [Vollenhovia emeryi]